MYSWNMRVQYCKGSLWKCEEIALTNTWAGGQYICNHLAFSSTWKAILYSNPRLFSIMKFLWAGYWYSSKSLWWQFLLFLDSYWYLETLNLKSVNDITSWHWFAHVLGPLHFIWWIGANNNPSTHQEPCFLNFELTKWVQEKNC